MNKTFYFFPCKRQIITLMAFFSHLKPSFLHLRRRPLREEVRHVLRWVRHDNGLHEELVLAVGQVGRDLLQHLHDDLDLGRAAGSYGASVRPDAVLLRRRRLHFEGNGARAGVLQAEDDGALLLLFI